MHDDQTKPDTVLRVDLFKPASGKYAYGGLVKVPPQTSLNDRLDLMKQILRGQDIAVPTAFADYDVVVHNMYDAGDDGLFCTTLMRQERCGHEWAQAWADIQAEQAASGDAALAERSRG